MNNIIAASRLAQMLTEKCNVSEAQAVLFIKEYFDTAFKALVSGENVELPGIGVFQLPEAPGAPLLFIPAQGLDNAVRSPFQDFVPVEIPDEIDAGQLEQCTAINEAITEPDNRENFQTEVPGDEADEPEIEPAASTEAAEDIEPAPQEETEKVIHEVIMVDASVNETSETLAKETLEEVPQEIPENEVFPPVFPGTLEIDDEPEYVDEDKVIFQTEENPEPSLEPCELNEEKKPTGIVEQDMEKSIEGEPQPNPEYDTSDASLADTEELPGIGDEPPAIVIDEEPPTITPKMGSQSNPKYRKQSSPKKVTYSWLTFWIILAAIAGLGIGALVTAIVLPHSSFTFTRHGVTVSAPVDYDEETEQEIVVMDETDGMTDEETETEAEAEAEADDNITDNSSEDKTIVVAQGAPKVKGTYETVSQTTFLTTLARRHYGQMEYWVYIYDANPGLGNPNAIKPGTKVFVPDKTTLPLTGDLNTDVDKAKKRSAEIYSKYKKE